MTFAHFLTIVALAMIFVAVAMRVLLAVVTKKPQPKKVVTIKHDHNDKAWGDYVTRIAVKRHPFN